MLPLLHASKTNWAKFSVPDFSNSSDEDTRSTRSRGKIARRRNPLCVYIYIYGKRARERERDIYIYVIIYTYNIMYVYIYIYPIRNIDLCIYTLTLAGRGFFTQVYIYAIGILDQFKKSAWKEKTSTRMLCKVIDFSNFHMSPDASVDEEFLTLGHSSAPELNSLGVACIYLVAGARKTARTYGPCR